MSVLGEAFSVNLPERVVGGSWEFKNVNSAMVEGVGSVRTKLAVKPSPDVWIKALNGNSVY